MSLSWQLWKLKWKKIKLLYGGVLDDIQPDGYGFLRTVNYSKGEKDIYISASQIRRFEIKRGDKVTGKVRKPKDNEKYYGLLQVDFVNDENAEVVKNVLISKHLLRYTQRKELFLKQSLKTILLELWI